LRVTNGLAHRMASTAGRWRDSLRSTNTIILGAGLAKSDLDAELDRVVRASIARSSATSPPVKACSIGQTSSTAIVQYHTEVCQLLRS
jgi:hypothetical protein